MDWSPVLEQEPQQGHVGHSSLEDILRFYQQNYIPAEVDEESHIRRNPGYGVSVVRVEWRRRAGNPYLYSEAATVGIKSAEEAKRGLVQGVSPERCLPCPVKYRLFLKSSVMRCCSRNMKIKNKDKNSSTWRTSVPTKNTAEIAFTEMMDAYMNATTLTKAEQINIEQQTRGQSTSPMWMEERKTKLTANFKAAISCSVEHSNKIRAMLYNSLSTAVTEYATLAGSFSGLVRKDGQFIKGMEVKCPLSKQGISAEDGQSGQQVLSEASEQIRQPDHKYNDQVQGQLYCCELDWVDFVVYFGQDFDDPWVEHARWYPGCELLGQLEGGGAVVRAEQASRSSPDYTQSQQHAQYVLESALDSRWYLFRSALGQLQLYDSHLRISLPLGSGKHRDRFQVLLQVNGQAMVVDVASVQFVKNPPSTETARQVSLLLEDETAVMEKLQEVLFTNSSGFPDLPCGIRPGQICLHRLDRQKKVVVSSAAHANSQCGTVLVAPINELGTADINQITSAKKVWRTAQTSLEPKVKQDGVGSCLSTYSVRKSEAIRVMDSGMSKRFDGRKLEEPDEVERVRYAREEVGSARTGSPGRVGSGETKVHLRDERGKRLGSRPSHGGTVSHRTRQDYGEGEQMVFRRLAGR
ncbi:Baculoviral IAP repeat-containing protein 2 [Branchiostoma belcheri]|nr:Baculoviral IAP repeat-containing protein 2 [Branchiostoma belcheri]